MADIGAGEGYFTLKLAAAVGPSGKVYAVEVAEEEIASLRQSVKESSHANIEIIHGEYRDPLLPDDTIDLIFLCNTYHHIIISRTEPCIFHDYAPI